jgi:hypothetical protein
MNKDFLSSKLRKQVGLEYEDTIVWLKKVERVVEKRVVCKNRTKRPKGKFVGYSTLVEDSPNNGTSGCFNRRIFLEDANGTTVNEVYPGVSVSPS